MDLLIFMVFNFVIYSFLGWIVENMYSLITIKSLKKDGFLNGPFKPMYGFAAAILVFLNEYMEFNLLVMVMLAFVIPTAVEYLTGYMLKEWFNKSYWDYSKLKYNLDGIISFKFSLYWIVLSFFTMYCIQPLLEIIFEKSFIFWSVFIPIIITCITIDFLFTLKSIEKREVLK